jgi:Protein of unknown function (DUF3383).
MKIESIVKVDITRETTSKTIRDLQTTAILSVHTRFAEDYREYEDTTSMLSDGFLTTDFAYIAASRMFAQNPRVRSVIVGKAVETTGTVDYVAEINKLLAATSEWFFLITDADTDAEKIAIATFIETQDLIYVTHDSNPAAITSATTDLASVLKGQSMMHTIVMYTKDTALVAPEAAYVGRHSTVTIGSNLWGYKTLVGLTPENYTTTEVGYLKDKNLQFYTKVGADPVIVGNMNVVGGEKIHVMLGSIWLKVRIAERYWNLLLVNERILYTNAGIDLFKAELYTVLSEAVTNNILTDETPFQINVPNALNLTSQQRANGVLDGITFRARLAGAIIYVDGVKGTVYP